MANEVRLIDANALESKLQEHHDFFVDGVGGFRYLTPKDKARVDEITNCIAEVGNAPTVDAVEVVHGRWETHNQVDSVFYCSECKPMKFKGFEICPTCFLDGHTDPKRWDVVKWCKSEPFESVDLRTGEKKIRDTYCYSVAQIEWNEKEPCWEFSSVGTRFLEDYEEGLCEFILKWLELTDLTRRFTDER